MFLKRPSTTVLKIASPSLPETLPSTITSNVCWAIRMRPQMLPISWHEHVSLGTTSVISQTVPIRPTSASEQAWHRRFLDHKIMTDMANLKWNMEPEDEKGRTLHGRCGSNGWSSFSILKRCNVDQCWGYTPFSNTLK